MARTNRNDSPNWSGIRHLWEQKTISVRALARLFSVDEKAIRSRAKRESWSRSEEDQSAGANQPRTSHRSDAWPALNVSSTVSALSEDIDPAEIAMAGRGLVGMLANELSCNCRDATELVAEVLDAEKKGERHPRRRAMLTGLASIGTRASAVRNLASAIGLLANAGLGKKAEADAQARRVVEDDDWGELLCPSYARRKPN